MKWFRFQGKDTNDWLDYIFGIGVAVAIHQIAFALISSLLFLNIHPFPLDIEMGKFRNFADLFKISLIQLVDVEKI